MVLYKEGRLHTRVFKNKNYPPWPLLFSVCAHTIKLHFSHAHGHVFNVPLLFCLPLPPSPPPPSPLRILFSKLFPSSIIQSVFSFVRKHFITEKFQITMMPECRAAAQRAAALEHRVLAWGQFPRACLGSAPQAIPGGQGSHPGLLRGSLERTT